MTLSIKYPDTYIRLTGDELFNLFKNCQLRRVVEGKLILFFLQIDWERAVFFSDGVVCEVIGESHREDGHYFCYTEKAILDAFDWQYEQGKSTKESVL